MGNCTVESPGHGRELFNIIHRHDLIHFVEFGAKGGNVFLRRTLNDGRERQHLQRIADGIDFVHIFDGKGAHNHPTAQHIYRRPLQLA